MAFGEAFRGLDEAAFRAFEPRKWSSNMFNVERLAVREQLRAIGTFVEGVMTADRPFKWDVTPHTPSVFNNKKVSDLVLYFTRNDAQQKTLAPLLDSRIALPDQISDAGEHHHHVCLGARASTDGVEVGLMLHSAAWLDVMNLLNRCRQPAEAAEFLSRVHALPAGSVVRVGPGREVDAPDLTLADLHRLEEAVLNETFVIFIGRRNGPDDPVLRASRFPEVCRDLLASLLPLWDFVAWRPASDFLMQAAIAASPSPSARDSQGQPSLSSGPVPLPTALPDLGTGARVRLIDGVFAGRQGIIMALDGKGNVKVLIGKVTVRTEVRSVRVV